MDDRDWEEKRAAKLAQLALKRDGRVARETFATVEEALLRYHQARRNFIDPRVRFFPDPECCAFMYGTQNSENLDVRRIGMLFLLDCTEYLLEFGYVEFILSWLYGDLWSLCGSDPEDAVQAFRSQALSASHAKPRWLRELRRLLLTLLDDDRVPTRPPGISPGSEHPRSDGPRRWLKAIHQLAKDYDA